MASSGNSSDGKMKIKVESETSELYVDVKETDKVRDLLKIVQRTWGDGDEYMTLHHGSQLMLEHHPLSFYNIKNGSVLTLSVFCDQPHDDKTK